VGGRGGFSKCSLTTYLSSSVSSPRLFCPVSEARFFTLMYVCMGVCVCMCVCARVCVCVVTGLSLSCTLHHTHKHKHKLVLAKRHHQIFSIYGVYIRFWPNGITRYSAYTVYIYGSGQTIPPDIQRIRSIHTVLAKRHHQMFSIYGVYIRFWPNDITRYAAYTEYIYGSGQTASPDIQHIRCIYTVLAKRHHQIFSIYGVYIRFWPNDITRYSAYTEYNFGSGQTASPDIQHIRCIYTVLANPIYSHVRSDHT